MIIGTNTTPPSETNVKKEDGAISKSYNVEMKGISASTWNGGIMQPVMAKKIYAGTKIKRLTFSGQIRMLTPLAPLTTKLTTTFKAFFVPNSRVWDNAEQFIAHKGQQTTTEEPSFTIKKIIFGNYPPDSTELTPLTDYDDWRECKMSGYVPRIMTGQKININNPGETAISTKISALPFRGYRAIFNDFIRNKQLDSEVLEFTGNSTNLAEEIQAFPLERTTTTTTNESSLKFRGQKPNNYYTNFRTDLIGSTTTEYQDTINANTQTLMYHTEWQKTLPELRENAENKGLNDWEIIAKMRGARVANQGKVQLIGQKSVGHNYSQVAQTVYNEATPNPEFQSLGTTGAYSWTEFSIDIVNYEEIIEDGYLHVIAQTSADVAFSTGINRELLNIKWDQQYRPELAKLKQDVLLSQEIRTAKSTDWTTPIKGYKRKYSECFELPQHITGDLTELGFPKSTATSDPIPSESFWLCQETSLFEIDNSTSQPFVFATKFWKDNTDILINNTMALKQKLKSVSNADMNHRVLGKNQFKMIAETTMIADLPFDYDIKKDYKEVTEV